MCKQICKYRTIGFSNKMKWIIALGFLAKLAQCDMVINSDFGLSVSPAVSAVAFNITKDCSPAGIAFEMASDISNVDGIYNSFCISPATAAPTQDWARTIDCDTSACTFTFSGVSSTTKQVVAGGLPVYFVANTSGKLKVSVRDIMNKLKRIPIHDGMNTNNTSTNATSVMDHLVNLRLRELAML